MALIIVDLRVGVQLIIDDSLSISIYPRSGAPPRNIEMQLAPRADTRPDDAACSLSESVLPVPTEPLRLLQEETRREMAEGAPSGEKEISKPDHSGPNQPSLGAGLLLDSRAPLFLWSLLVSLCPYI